MDPSPIRSYESSGGPKDPRLRLIPGERSTRPQPRALSVRDAAIRNTRIERYLALPEPVVPAAVPRPRRYLLWLAIFFLTVMAVLGWIVFWPREVAQYSSPVRPEPVRPEPPHSADAFGLDRLTDALAVVPGPAIPALFQEANHWLATHGSPPCSAQSPSGQVSIVLGSGTIPDKPLASALSRCADAMEDLLKGPAP